MRAHLLILLVCASHGRRVREHSVFEEWDSSQNLNLSAAEAGSFQPNSEGATSTSINALARLLSALDPALPLAFHPFSQPARGRFRAGIATQMSSDPAVSTAAQGSGPSAASSTIKVIVSVDWEGMHLRDNNIKAMERFRHEFPEVPLLHFMNAAYFTKPKADHNEVLGIDWPFDLLFASQAPYEKQVKDKIDRVIRESDELGIHLHCWKSLVEAAGVAFCSEPRPGCKLGDCDKGDCGFYVPLTSYTTDEVRRILHFCKQIFSEQGYGTPVAFRAGSWLACDETFKALIDEGFTLDSSAVPTDYLDRYPKLQPLLKPLWKGISNTSQPYLIKWDGPALQEVPNNGCLSDYVSAEQMLEVFKENVQLWRDNPSEGVVFCIGFHQESAQRTLRSRLEKGIRLIQDHCLEHDLPLEFVSRLDSHMVEGAA